jgi:hypothetical protein
MRYARHIPDIYQIYTRYIPFLFGIYLVYIRYILGIIMSYNDICRIHVVTMSQTLYTISVPVTLRFILVYTCPMTGIYYDKQAFVLGSRPAPTSHNRTCRMTISRIQTTLQTSRCLISRLQLMLLRLGSARKANMTYAAFQLCLPPCQIRVSAWLNQASSIQRCS